MENPAYPAGGAALGVTVPIVVEYFAKGKRLGSTTEEPNKGVKYSAIMGLGVGVGSVGVAVYDHYQPEGKKLLSNEARGFAAGLGGGALATGVSVLVLDELRKRKLYEFKKSGKVPKDYKLPPGGEGLETESASQMETSPMLIET